MWYCWLKEIIVTGEGNIEYIRGDEIVADGLIKELEKTKHELFITMPGLYQIGLLDLSFYFLFVKTFLFFKHYLCQGCGRRQPTIARWLGNMSTPKSA